MSIYSSEITTRLIDPVFDKSNFRSEYRLQNDTVYLASLRLLDVGFSSSATNGYNRLLGSLGCIESIQLFSGNELLDQILQATLLNALRSANTNNNGYGIGLNFDDEVDLSNQKFNLQVSSGISSATPMILYMYFHSTVSV